MNNIKKISPWAWVPTLYFAQGIPYFIVNNISVLMFAKMGVPNGDMALFTSLLYLPWTIKPFWSPFVDIIKTKRWWVVSMQILMSIAFILLTLTIPRPDEATMAAGTTPISMFTLTLILFIITAFASATHDIAADGFYMLALKSGEQAEFVGIRSTFYRLASIFGQGVLVAIAGAIELKYDNIPLSWTITMLVTAVMFSAVSLYHLFAIPKPASDKSVLAPGTASAKAIFKEFGRTFATYFTKPGVLLAIIFMLLYRLPEAFLIKMCMPFLVASKEAGGLELSTAEVGIVYGTIGVIFLTLGGYSRRTIRITYRIKEIHLVDGGLYDAALSDLRLSGYLPTRKPVCHIHGHCHRTIRLRIRFHSLYALYDVLFRRRVQNIPLCHLYRIHGIEYDDSGYVCGLHPRSYRLYQLLLDGNHLLYRHCDSYRFRRQKNRPGIWKKVSSD